MKLVGRIYHWLMAGYTLHIRRKIHCKGKLILTGVIEIESGERIHVGGLFPAKKRCQSVHNEGEKT